jgi:hypothetical protein
MKFLSPADGAGHTFCSVSPARFAGSGGLGALFREVKEERPQGAGDTYGKEYPTRMSLKKRLKTKALKKRPEDRFHKTLAGGLVTSA